MNKTKRTIRLKRKDEDGSSMKVEVKRNKILSSKGFVRDLKYNTTTRIDLVEEKYEIPEGYSI